MRVFSYVVVSDTGFAPNPFHGVCTLACCKPEIRSVARVGDLVVGMSSRCERIVYAMQVSRALTFGDYWSDEVGRAKRAKGPARTARERLGDCIYGPIGKELFHASPSAHAESASCTTEDHCRRDLGGKYVLLASRFCYFGGHGPPLPQELKFLRVQRGHRSRFAERQVRAVSGWFSGLPNGILGRPSKWPDGDESWREEELGRSKGSV